MLTTGVIKLNITKCSYLDIVLIMLARDALHEMGCWMVTEVRADITNPQTTIAGFVVSGVLVWGLVQDINLLKAEGSMSGKATRLHHYCT